MKKVARMLRNHKPLIMNWFEAKGTLSSRAVEKNVRVTIEKIL